MFKSYPFTKLFLLSIVGIIVGWIINALTWSGIIPWINQTIFVGMGLMYISFALLIISLVFGLFKIIRNV